MEEDAEKINRLEEGLQNLKNKSKDRLIEIHGQYVLHSWETMIFPLELNSILAHGKKMKISPYVVYITSKRSVY